MPMNDAVANAVTCQELNRLVGEGLLPLLLAGWHNARLQGFIRDTIDREDPDTHEIDPATQKYFAYILAVRPDGMNFYHRIVVDRDYADWPAPQRISYIDSVVQNTALQFNSFLGCTCQVGKLCERHDRVAN